MDAVGAVRAYDALLASIGDRAAAIEPRPLVGHWPHRGSAYNGLLIVGQALRGWYGEWQAREAETSEGRARIIASSRAGQTSADEPLAWIASSRVRTSPFWQFSRHLVDALEPGEAPWYARYCWANLYPVAPEAPPDNPRGALKGAQDRFVGPLLLEFVRALDARRVVVIAGPDYWYWPGRVGDLATLKRAERPLMWAGSAYGRRWVVGYHPKWASHNGWGPSRYAQLVTPALLAAR